jgi:hypothetical protein
MIVVIVLIQGIPLGGLITFVVFAALMVAVVILFAVALFEPVVGDPRCGAAAVARAG